MSYEDLRKAQRSGGQTSQPAQAAPKSSVAPGKRTRTQSLALVSAGPGAPVQMKPDPMADPARPGRIQLTERWIDTAIRPDLHPPPVQMHGGESVPSAGVHELAAQGLSGTTAALPHLDRIQQAFGEHDVRGISVHVGGLAADACRGMNAVAYASGERIAFASIPELHTAAHEAAHVVQQRAGVQLTGGVGRSGDAYERQADAVADAVVAGTSAQPLLGAVSPGTGADAAGHGVVQLQEQPKPDNGGELRQRARHHAQRIRDALGRTFLMVFSDPDGQIVYDALNQPAELVRVIRDVYDAQFDTISGKGLVADLQSAFDGEDFELMAALLSRADISVDDVRLTHHAQDPDGGYDTQTQIVAEPQHPSVPPGAAIRYSTVRGAEIYSSDSYYTYQWYCLNDPSTRAMHDSPARIDGPTTAFWDATWDFPGEHTIVCRVQFHPGNGSPWAPEYIEYRQRVRPLEDIAADAFAQSESADFVRFRAGLEMQHLALSQYGVADQDFGGTHIQSSGPNPAVPGTAPDLVHHTYTVTPVQGATRFRWYALYADEAGMPTKDYFGFRRIDVAGQNAYDMGEGTSARWIIASHNIYTIVCEQRDDADQLLGKAIYRQVVHSKKKQEAVESWRGYMARVDEQIQTIDEDRRVGIRASYVNRETGAVLSPSLFIGPDTRQPGQIKLLDLTPGIDRIEYSGEDVQAVLEDFRRGNSYPTGRLTLEIPANEAEVPPLSAIIDTDGESDWATWAAGLGWASLGLAVLGVAAAVIPGGQVVAPALFIAAAGAGMASSGLSIYDELQQAEVSGLSIAIDVLGIASSIVGGAAAFRTARQGIPVALANRSTQYLLYTGVGLDVTSGVLLSIDAFDQLLDILDGEMPEGEKISAIVRILASLAINGGLIALSVQGGSHDTGELVQRIHRRIEHKPKFKLAYTEAELESIVNKGTKLGLDERLIEDMIYAGSREAKAIRADELMQQMESWIAVKNRGYPYRFEHEEQFHAFEADLIAAVKKAGLPVDDVRIQGSALRNPNARDVDIAIFMDESEFDQLLIDRFEGKAKMNGPDGSKISLELSGKTHAELVQMGKDIMAAGRQSYNGMARTFGNAVKEGIISSKSDISRGLKDAKNEVAAAYESINIESISVLIRGGEFDITPDMPVGSTERNP